MTRAAAPVFGAGMLALALWVVLAWLGVQVMPSYMAAWLFWMALPLGALPVVMALEALGDPAGAMALTLRRLLPLLPAGAVLAIPFLLRTEVLFRRPGLSRSLPDAWMAPGFFAGRTLLLLLVLSVLALVFCRLPRRRPRRVLAVIGLLLHVCLISLGAADWLLSLQPGLSSSELGLLLIASQTGVACCVAGLALAVSAGRDVDEPNVGRLLAVLLAIWAFLHFVQYLLVWSANLPDEVTWYQARTPGFGAVTIWFAVTATAAGLLLLPTRLARVPAVLASIAAMLLLMHLLEALWLVTPAFRGLFTLQLADFGAVLGIGGLTLAGLLLLLPRTTGEQHARL